MIGTYWGGTPAEAWTSLGALKAVPVLAPLAERFENLLATLPQQKETYDKETLPKWEAANAALIAANDSAQKKWKEDAAAAQAAGQPAPAPLVVKAPPRKPNPPDQNPNAPTVLTNGMIAPIVPYAIKGAIWYQGESNAGRANEYQTLFPAMITDWRTRWSEGDFPFIWVQLANYDPHPAPGNKPVQSADLWPGLREAQSMTLKLPNTGQAVIIDIGQASDIHPKDKQDVGQRLALAARHVAYGEDLIFSGPTYDSIKIDADKARVTFKNIGSGLTIAAAPSTQPGVPQAAPADQLEGFSIAGADHKFVWATATIDGDSVIVSSPDVHDPQAVRYAWANNPKANLYNKEGLPASPFRTDDWGNPTAAGK
jgi:sialate O-acetylesterase